MNLAKVLTGSWIIMHEFIFKICDNESCFLKDLALVMIIVTLESTALSLSCLTLTYDFFLVTRNQIVLSRSYRNM